MSQLGETDGRLNTTEQILQAVSHILAQLERQNHQYNWDPATFSVTVVIGIIAIFFAGLTIIQGLIAAGPGRLKSGQYAIGPWSKLTRRKFIRAELRLRTVAYTPVIRFQDPHVAFWLDEETTVSESPSILRKRVSEYFPAGWLALLTLVGLDKPANFEKKAVGADYIPMELAAAPAYGSIRDTINLILSYSTRLSLIEKDPVSRLLSVRGSATTGTFGLNFFNHPLLGTVGSFEMFAAEPPEKQEIEYNIHPSLSAQDDHVSQLNLLKESLSCAYGSVECFVRDPRSAEIEHFSFNWMPWYYKSTRVVFSKPFEPGLQRLVAVVESGCHHHKDRLSIADIVEGSKAFSLPLFTSYPGETLPSFLTNTLEHKLENIQNTKKAILCFAALATAKVYTTPPRVFPHTLANITGVLDSLLIQSDFWSDDFRCYGMEPPFTNENQGTAYLMDPPKLDKVVFEVSWRFIRALSIDRSDSCGVIMNILNEIPVNFIFDRRHLLAEMKSIDDWVRDEKPRDWNCRMLVLINIAGLVHDMARRHQLLLEAILSNEAEAQTKEAKRYITMTWQKCKDHSFSLLALQQESHGEEVMNALKRFEKLWQFGPNRQPFEGVRTAHPLDDLIIYRIIIHIMLLSTASDNSIVMEEGFHDRVVPML
ncbi:hypothetical protein PT974_02321 [Cladobotryum mycophilum]|uniref:Uncharacterized protein n=1 Tax=Cladobotryum mycophilum TaxID=491253 RepID=A0ABR0SXU4_9HYPO